MKHAELHCPNCGSDRVHITDHQPLATNDMETPVDKEIYVKLKCDHCKASFSTVGEISYLQPETVKPKRKEVFYTISFMLDEDTDVQDFRISIESALGCSDNITSKGYSNKIVLVG